MNISNLGTRSERKSFERLKSSSISNSVRYRTCHHTACKARQLEKKFFSPTVGRNLGAKKQTPERKNQKEL
jgi:hypothetical protein